MEGVKDEETGVGAAELEEEIKELADAGSVVEDAAKNATASGELAGTLVSTLRGEEQGGEASIPSFERPQHVCSLHEEQLRGKDRLTERPLQQTSSPP
jgi:hypothetical protein